MYYNPRHNLHKKPLFKVVLTTNTKRVDFELGKDLMKQSGKGDLNVNLMSKM